jgi:hypothetical protein
MTQIQIICSKPGIRRNGIEHPAQAIYELGRWTNKELEAFRADPAFIVQEVHGKAAEVSSAEIEQAVKARLEIDRQKLQESFNQAVADAVAEKLADTKAAHDNAIDELGKKLLAAETEIATLKSAQVKGSENPQSGTEAGGAGEANASEGKPKPKK